MTLKTMKRISTLKQYHMKKKNCTISLCLNYSSERGYYYSVESPKDDFGQIDYCKFIRRDLFNLPKGISLNIEDGMTYFYDNRTGASIPSYEMITIEGNIPAIVIPSEDFTTLRFQRESE